MAEKTFSDTMTAITDLPITWYPKILEHVIAECIRKGVFREGRIGAVAEMVETKIRNNAAVEFPGGTYPAVKEE